MPKDMSVPAARKALRYVGKPGDPVGGGLPAADVSAEEAAGWYTAGQVQEALDIGSHAYADESETPKKAHKKNAPPAEPEPAAAPPDDAPKESET